MFSVLRDLSCLLNCNILTPINESLLVHSAKMVNMTEEQNWITHQLSLNSIPIQIYG